MMRVVAVTALTLLVACALKTPPPLDETVANALPGTTHIPDAWVASPDAKPVLDGWLGVFADPRLDAIVAEAMQNNPDLKQAAQRVEVSRQNAYLVGSQLLPHVNGVAAARTTRDEDHDSTYTSKIGFGSVAWELDIWGQLRAQRAAAQAGYAANQYAYAWARQSLAATTAMLWYLAVETRQLLANAKEGERIYRDLLTLVQARRRAGKSDDLDVVDMQAKYSGAQAETVAAQRNFDEARRSLEALLGRYPAAEIDVVTDYPPLVPFTGAGVPAALLERRPDLVAAERAVLAAFRNQEVAELARLPQFSVSFVAGWLDDGALSQLHLNPWVVSGDIGMSIPIYEGGAIRAQLEIATAQQQQAIAAYGQKLLTAFTEVEDGLANERLLAQQLPLEEQSLKSLTEAVRIATIQYKAGRRDLLWVGQLQSSQLAAQMQLIKLRGEQYRNRLRLELALGSSFDTQPASTTQ